MKIKVNADDIPRSTNSVVITKTFFFISRFASKCFTVTKLWLLRSSVIVIAMNMIQMSTCNMEPTNASPEYIYGFITSHLKVRIHGFREQGS